MEKQKEAARASRMTVGGAGPETVAVPKGAAPLIEIRDCLLRIEKILLAHAPSKVKLQFETKEGAAIPHPG